MRLCKFNTQLKLYHLLSFILCMGITIQYPSAFAKKDEIAPILTVRYSYEKQTKDGESRYVLVPTVQKVNGADFADQKKRHKALFMSMKNDKKANYGGTGFNMSDDAVLIFLDSSKERNFPFIMAEAIYTFTENGARAVRFPKSKFSGRDYKRSDVDFPSYRLILPYWEGLPPDEVQGALLSLGDGSLLTSKALKERVMKGDKELVLQLVSTLKKGNIQAVSAIVETTKLVTLKGVEEGFIPLLQAAQPKLRSIAVDGLVNQTSDQVFKALREVMDTDPDPSIKDKAAMALSKAKDPKIAAAALFHTLRSTDIKVAVQAAEKLIKTKSKEADEELLKAVKRTEVQIRSAAINTLVLRQTITPLVKLLNGELGIEVKVEIAKAIRDQKTARKSAYKFLVTQPNGEAASEAINSLKGEKLKGDVASWFESALRHPDASTRVTVASQLTQFKGSSALKVLATADIDDEKSGEEVHKAMRSIYNKMSDKVILNDCARESSISLKSAATGVLGKLYQRAKKKNKARAFKAIGQLVQSPKSWVRAEGVRSLKDVGTEEAMDILIKLKDDNDLKVKRSVARSTVAFAEDKMRPILVAYLKEKDNRVIEYSLDSLGQLKSKEALDELFNDTYLAHKSVKVRRAAMQAVASIAEVLTLEKRESLATRINLRLTADSDSEARIAGAKALSYVATEESRIALSTQLQDKDVELVKSIVDALVKHAVPSSIKLIEGAMDHRNPKVRAYAYDRASKLEGEGLQKVVKDLFIRRLKIEDDEALKATLNAFMK